MKNIGMMLVASKVASTENTGLFNEYEMRIIRACAFISCVKENEVCVSAAAIARMCHHSPTTIRKWCSEGKIKCLVDSSGHNPGVYEIPLSSVIDLKQTNWDVNKDISLDIKKVDF